MKGPRTRAEIDIRGSSPRWSVLVTLGIAALVTGGAGPRSPQPEGPEEDKLLKKQFAVILRQGDGGEREIHLERLLDRDQFDKKHKELKQDYVLEDFEVVESGGALYFSGVWHRSSPPVQQRLELMMSRERFDKAHAAAMAGGLFPADFETYLDGRGGEEQRWFAGLWTDDASKRESELIMDVGAQDVQDIAGDQDATRTIVDLESWIETGDRRYLAVHRPRDPSTVTVTILDKSFEAYNAIVEVLTTIGYRPLELEIGGRAGGAPFYSATWEKAEDAYWLFTGVDEKDHDCRLVSLGIDIESSHLRADDFACCQTLGRDDASESDGKHTCEGIAIHKKEVPGNSVHIVDFVVTRHALKPPTPGKPTHSDVPHDEGATVP